MCYHDDDYSGDFTWGDVVMLAILAAVWVAGLWLGFNAINGYSH